MDGAFTAGLILLSGLRTRLNVSSSSSRATIWRPSCLHAWIEVPVAEERLGKGKKKKKKKLRN